SSPPAGRRGAVREDRMDARRVGLPWSAVCLALLSVFLARPVLGQTSTSTSTSTTTTTVTTTSTTTVTTTSTSTTTLPPGAGRVTCVVESDSVYVNGPYHVLGHCIMSPGYADGGDGFSAANTLKDAGKALCNSPQRVPIVVLVEAAHPAPADRKSTRLNSSHL